MDTIKIKFLNSNGGGFAENLEVPANYTIGQLLKNKLGEGFVPGNYFIRVNRQLVTVDYELKADDSVTVTPSKIEGARLAA